MVNAVSLQRAAVIGTVLQIAMIAVGHFVPWVRDHVFMFGGMTISAVAGYLYASAAGSGYGSAALGGAIAGAGCALIGIAASVLLADTAMFVLAAGTAASAVTGAVGGLLGNLAARKRPAGAS